MAKKEQIKVVEKSIEWFKNLFGVSDDFIILQNIKRFPIAYVYEIYPYGGGDDQIKMMCFQEILPDEYVQKRFANSKIRGHLQGDVCMVDLSKHNN